MAFASGLRQRCQKFRMMQILKSNLMTRYINALFAALLVTVVSLAQNPVPAKKQVKNILLMNGTAHLGNGKVIENSAVAFKDGKITLVADATVIRIDKTAY